MLKKHIGSVRCRLGLVAVYEGKVIAKCYNMRETLGDPTAHAEMLAIRQASAFLGKWRLTGVTLYVTLEPCPMCAGAIINSRIDRLVYGARDPKAGAAGTLFDIVRDERLNHSVNVRSGVLEDKCTEILKDFFAALRERQ